MKAATSGVREAVLGAGPDVVKPSPAAILNPASAVHGRLHFMDNLRVKTRNYWLTDDQVIRWFTPDIDDLFG